jgi:phage portal protein BeeE
MAGSEGGKIFREAGGGAAPMKRFRVLHLKFFCSLQMKCGISPQFTKKRQLKLNIEWT